MRWWHLIIGVAVVTATVLATMGLYKRYISKNGCGCTTTAKASVTDIAVARDTAAYGMGGKKVF